MTRDEWLGLGVVLATLVWALFGVTEATLGFAAYLVVYGVTVRWFVLRRLRRGQRSVADAARDDREWWS